MRDRGRKGRGEEGEADAEDPGTERAGCIACFPPIPRPRWRTSVKAPKATDGRK